MTWTRDYHIEHVVTQSGQARAYGPTEYIGKFRMTNEVLYGDDKGEMKPAKLPRDDAKSLANLLGIRWNIDLKEPGDVKREWWMQKLMVLEPVGDGWWRYHVHQDYLD